MDQSARAWGSRAGLWTRVGARAAAVGDETSSWWSPVSCEPGGGVTPERRCVMAEKQGTQWRRVLFTRG
ncbi:hypothetical protein TSUD_204340 [Trifolium subterraneum]|uniref:Uncharacterized protein n=1 Tax=Trifolium subterraneum TaxID=3900 RepID=A0A2Z6NJS5_TRISU|nr:hypothetical protein TSUD_204340 [Trifolium subterraneum]